jgi:Tfp pilus assembly protein PilF
MQLYRLTPIALLALAGCASSSMQGAGLAEVGYEPGTLAFAAIMDQDWSKAEAQLTDSNVADDDPAKLLNLAHVYRKTGREADALRLYRQVAEQRNHFMVELADGSVASSRELALRAIGDTEQAALGR